MAGETIITVVGNLTADPELRYTQGGLAVANFTIASTPRTFDRQANDWKDGEALFLRASVWREFAENVAGTLTKGSRVVATGRLKQRSYETKEGEKRTSIELEIDEIGPSLRYATAQVTRAAGGGGGRGQVGGGQGGQGASQGGFGGGNQGGSGGNGGGNRGGGQAEEPWAPSAPAGGDVWSTPGSYNDETPF
ncbi:single-stranded DNA-binding protein [Rathayibacter sp. VKM Ac-2760]|uniref:single-stranded DNA-binding protein n=1 Tax=Rathayibacter sp. VKM Ac-2760 TaxID=2609253 RepID=UPI001315CB1B|nr:single-stranded DNA-binding protein [Rathayibacter sp. VKM Ac-2760]QHC60515.1 single-stranded DNA-binding protein [Rathayibacter sp. VKM Ac-2760]